jgi:hypothetical protein
MSPFLRVKLLLSSLTEESAMMPAGIDADEEEARELDAVES